MEKLDELELTQEQLNEIIESCKASGLTIKEIASSIQAPIPSLRLIVPMGDGLREAAMEYRQRALTRAESQAALELAKVEPKEGLVFWATGDDWVACYAESKMFPLKLSERERSYAEAHDMPAMEHESKMRTIFLWVYWCIQLWLQKTPEAFSEPTTRKEWSHPKNPKKKSKCYLITRRSLRLEPAGRVNIYTCPCWSVRGHWRKLKDGREIWIAPFKKGKQRGDPDAKVPKTYKPS